MIKASSLMASTLAGAVAVLLALGTLHFIGGRKGDSLRAGNQVRAVSIAMERYMRANSGSLPSFDNRQALESALLKYVDRRGAGNDVTSPLLARPETGEPYAFNPALSGKSRRQFARPETVIVFYESCDNYGGKLVAFLDGHHIWATRAQWERMRAGAKLPENHD